MSEGKNRARGGALTRESIKDRYVPRIARLVDTISGSRLHVDRTNLRFVSRRMLEPFSRHGYLSEPGSDRRIHRCAISAADLSRDRR